jgi:hypothetical protein
LPENFDECARFGTTTGSGITTSVIHIVIKIFELSGKTGTAHIKSSFLRKYSSFEESIPEVSKTFIHLFSILKITFFVITFFFESITYRIRTFWSKTIQTS